MQQIIATFKSSTSIEVLDQHIKVLLKNFDPEDEIIVSMYEYFEFTEVSILKNNQSHLHLVKYKC